MLLTFHFVNVNGNVGSFVFLKFRLALTTAVHALNHRYSGS